MDLPVDKFLEGLFSEEAANQPSDTGNEQSIVMELPSWYDKRKYDQGRSFYQRYSFMMTTSMFMGLVCVLSVPSILRVLLNSQRSGTKYTAYKRYVSTVLHTVSWFDHELKPGSIPWKSLHAVRTRHFRAGLSVKSKYNGTVSQRDLALTQFGFLGLLVLKPDRFGVYAVTEGDWEGYIHFWRTIGHMIGLEDRYNICRKTVHDTREVCQVIQDRVYTPCLENVPEYFEHMNRVLVEGMWSLNPGFDVTTLTFFVKYLADVPGYVLTEGDRIAFQKKLKAHLGDKPKDSGIKVDSLIQKSAVQGLPDIPPRVLYLHDYNLVESTPPLKSMTPFERFSVYYGDFILCLYGTTLGRLYFNAQFKWSLFLIQYFPYLAFLRWGFKNSFVDMFVESPKDVNASPKPNSFYYERKRRPWYLAGLYLIWGDP